MNEKCYTRAWRTTKTDSRRWVEGKKKEYERAQLRTKQAQEEEEISLTKLQLIEKQRFFIQSKTKSTFGPLYDPSAIKEKYWALLDGVKVIKTDKRREGRPWQSREIASYVKWRCMISYIQKWLENIYLTLLKQ